EDQNGSRAIRACGMDGLGDPASHVIIGSAAGQDHLAVVAELPSAKAQIVRVYTDAVPSDEAGMERQKIPFRAGGVEHVPGGMPQLGKNLGDLVHEGDV